MDNIRIRQLLPHRYPMQLVDKVVAMGATSIVGVKNVTANEPFFQGHFPEEPVMPGVLQIEAMAQCGGLLILSSTLKRRVSPGITLCLNLTSSIFRK